MLTGDVSESRGFFDVLATGPRTQVAVMNLEPNGASGEGLNTHEADQVLLVLEGEVHGEIGGREVTLARGAFVLVPKGTPHRFENRGRTRAVTFNVYAPPAY